MVILCLSLFIFKGKFSFSLSSCAIKDKHSPATGNVETAELAWIGYASFKEMLRDEPFQTPPIGHFLMRLYAFMIRSPIGKSVCKYCVHVIAAAATRVLLGPPAPLSYSPSFPYGRRLAPGTAARAERRFRLRAERILRRIRVRGRPRRSPPIASLPRAHQPRAASGGIRARNLDESRPFLSASRGSPFVLGTHGRAPSARVDVASRDI